MGFVTATRKEQLLNTGEDFPLVAYRTIPPSWIHIDGYSTGYGEENEMYFSRNTKNKVFFKFVGYEWTNWDIFI